MTELLLCMLCGRHFMPMSLYPDVGLLCDDSDGCRRTAVKQLEVLHGVPPGLSIYVDAQKEERGLRSQQP